MENALMVRSKVDFAWRADQLANLKGWRAVGMTQAKRRAFSEVVTDTRQISQPGALFIALRGERYDGHRFVAEAIAKGASGVVIAADCGLRAPAGVVTYLVKEPRLALAQLARFKRDAYGGIVAALTGSAGKTSTKAFAAALAGRSLYVNPGNFNNDIGVPLAIIAAPMTAPAWLLEFGMNAAGEIATLTDIAAPDYGLLLPPGRAHIGAFADAEAIARAKAEMAFAADRPKQLLVYGDAYDCILRGIAHKKIATTGAYDCVAGRLDFPHGQVFRLSEGLWRREITTSLHGQHWGTSLAAAWALCREMGLLSRAQAGRIAKLSAPRGRMTLQAYNGGWLLDDSYNASPESYLAFLQYLRQLPVGLRPRLLLGDMLELGRQAAKIHAEIAAAVAELDVARIDVVGSHMAKALRQQKIAHRVHKNADLALAAALKPWRPGAFLAVKGANGVGLYAALGKVLQRL